MGAFDVMDNLLRSSLLAEEAPLTDLQVELALLGEGTEGLLALWYMTTPSVFFEQAGGLVPWLSEEESPEERSKRMADEHAKKTGVPHVGKVRRMFPGDIYPEGRKLTKKRFKELGGEEGTKIVAKTFGQTKAGGKPSGKPARPPGPPTVGRLSPEPLPKDVSGHEMHQAMHHIAGIDDPKNLKPHERKAIGHLVHAHGKHMGYAEPRQQDKEAGEARDRALHTFMGTFEGKSGGKVRTTGTPYHGVREVAKEYVGRHKDPEKGPEDPHQHVAAIVRDKARKYYGYHYDELKGARERGEKTKPLTTTAKSGEEKTVEPVSHATGARTTWHVDRHQRIERAHDALGKGHHPAHAKILRHHFDYHDAPQQIEHHKKEIASTKEALGKATDETERQNLKTKLREHDKALDRESKRYSTASAHYNTLKKLSQERLDRAHAAHQEAKAAARGKHGAKGEGPDVAAAKAHHDKMASIHAAVHNPPEAKKYRVGMHVANASMGGHEEYGLSTEKKPAEKAEESVSLYDLVMEADDSETGEEGEEAPKVPGSIGTSHLPAGWKGAIAKHLGVQNSEVSRHIKSLFTGPEGVRFTHRAVQKTGERLPTREKKLYISAARGGRVHGGKGAGGAMGPEAHQEKQAKQAERKKKEWEGAVKPPVKPDLPGHYAGKRFERHVAAIEKAFPALTKPQAMTAATTRAKGIFSRAAERKKATPKIESASLYAAVVGATAASLYDLIAS